MTHVHKFHFAGLLEGCHWRIVTAACECGAVMRQESERDPAVEEDDFYAWADTSCERCTELESGAVASARSEVVPTRVR
jgi:hypothetical protein